MYIIYYKEEIEPIPPASEIVSTILSETDTVTPAAEAERVREAEEKVRSRSRRSRTSKRTSKENE